jgi:hypothetical protein
MRVGDGTKKLKLLKHGFSFFLPRKHEPLSLSPFKICVADWLLK